MDRRNNHTQAEVEAPNQAAWAVQEPYQQWARYERVASQAAGSALFAWCGYAITLTQPGTR